MQLASRFGRNSHSYRSATPLAEDQLRRVAPSIFAEAAHDSRSERYTYIPTAVVLQGLQKEGFQPFMVCQTRVRDETKRDFTKHMIRLRHAAQINDTEADEIVLLNSHDGTSSYQLLAGMFRFVCSNGLVRGDIAADVRIRHKGQVVDEVVEGAYDVLGQFKEMRDERDSMKAISLTPEHAEAFGNAALALKFDTEVKPAPITAAQVIRPQRNADLGNDLWRLLNISQENLIRGGLTARNAVGRRTTTRPVQGIDQNIKLNRALWVLAQAMQKHLA